MKKSIKMKNSSLPLRLISSSTSYLPIVNTTRTCNSNFTRQPCYHMKPNQKDPSPAVQYCQYPVAAGYWQVRHLLHGLTPAQSLCKHYVWFYQALWPDKAAILQKFIRGIRKSRWLGTQNSHIICKNIYWKFHNKGYGSIFKIWPDVPKKVSKDDSSIYL